MILLTGFKGFIGQNILNCEKFDKPFYLSEKDYCFEELNHFDWESVSEIWHIGAISDTTETDVNKIHKYNVEYTLKLFEIAIAYHIPVKYASSASVYGNTNYRREINPLNFYAMSKALIDKWVENNENRFVKIQGYRFYNVYGKHEDHKGNQASPVHTFIKQAKETGTIKLFENSVAYMRDFVWVEDVIDCMLYNKPNGIYDVGTGVARSFERVAEIIADKYNAKIKYIPFPKHLESKYQFFTCSKNHFVDHKFCSVEEYVRTRESL